MKTSFAAALAALLTCLAVLAGYFASLGGPQGESENEADSWASEEPTERAASWATWANMMEAADLDGDGGMESVELAGRRVSISSCDGDTGAVSTFQTDESWQVSNCFIADMEQGGSPEIVLLTWAEGSYGTSKPFWVDEDDAGFCQHVYLFHYEDGALVPVWMSSRLDAEITSASMDALDRLHLVDVEGTETVWAWEGFGLKLEGEYFADEAESASDQRDQEGAISLLAVGDCLVHEGMLDQALQSDGTYDFSEDFSELGLWASSCDVSVVGQETVLSDTIASSGNPPFCSPTAVGDALVGAGFNLVLLANNHANDQGSQAIRDEVAYWRAHHADATVLGAHEDGDERRYSLFESNGVTLALFDYTASLGSDEAAAGAEGLVDTLDDEAQLVSDLREIDPEVDFSVCFLHVGDEMHSEPSEEQRALCAELIDAGADVVICAHSHVVAPFEKVTTAQGAQGVVYYGLGNFISNQIDPTTALGAAARLTFRVCTVDGNRVAVVETPRLIPLVCHVDGGGTRVCLLSEYDEARAEQHVLHGVYPDFSRDYLVDLWQAVVVGGQTY